MTTPLSEKSARIVAAIEAERDLTDARIAAWLDGWATEPDVRPNLTAAALWLGIPLAFWAVVAAVVWWAW